MVNGLSVLAQRLGGLVVKSKDKTTVFNDSGQVVCEQVEPSTYWLCGVAIEFEDGTGYEGVLWRGTKEECEKMKQGAQDLKIINSPKKVVSCKVVVSEVEGKMPVRMGIRAN